MRALFAAFVVAGTVIVAVALALAVPFYETRAFGEMLEVTAESSMQPFFELQPWPDYLAVPPGMALPIFLWTGGLLVAGGAVGLVAKPVERFGLRMLLALGIVGAAAVAIVVAMAVSVPWDPRPAYEGLERVMGTDARLLVPRNAQFPVLPGTSIPIGSFATATAIAAAAALLAVLAGRWIAIPRGRKALAISTFGTAIVGGLLRGPGGGIFWWVTTGVPLALAAAVLVALAWLGLRVGTR